MTRFWKKQNIKKLKYTGFLFLGAYSLTLDLKWSNTNENDNMLEWHIKLNGFRSSILNKQNKITYNSITLEK